MDAMVHMWDGHCTNTTRHPPPTTPHSASSPEAYCHRELVTDLKANEVHIRNSPKPIQKGRKHNFVQIFCHWPEPFRLVNVFQSKYVYLEIDSDAEYQQFKGSTARSVCQSSELKRGNYEGKLLSRGDGSHLISLPAHTSTCYGILTSEPFNLTLLEEHLDEERFAMFVLGLTLYVAAPVLGGSLWFCYCTVGALSIYLGRVCVVCIALLFAKGATLKDLIRFRPVQENFKMVVSQHFSLVTSTLMVGAWIMIKFCHGYRRLWHNPWVPYIHRCLLRMLAYYKLYYASDKASFGLLWVCTLQSWPKLWWLLHWIKLKLIQLFMFCFPRKPQWGLRQQVKKVKPKLENNVRVYDLQYFFRFVNDGPNMMPAQTSFENPNTRR
ncbi:uncharacterized protein LOC115622199 [Scaptodrosophila lebanonensis]|uniref:Uncharacterized protein LOC115622199 n=1 Tax=Drosophila lebanonensis TaxID=7225 RepID=A0A6J2T9Z8_DROLE|nr:uncharacterized protein LOC115622199 [Scaptodrosophila lebanonensis]